MSFLQSVKNIVKGNLINLRKNVSIYLKKLKAIQDPYQQKKPNKKNNVTDKIIPIGVDLLSKQNMNKSIFQKIKKSNLESITESHSSNQNIQYMSVQDMEKTLLTQINSSRDPSTQNVVISENRESIKSSTQKINDSNLWRSSIVESRKVPEIIMENDQLKNEIQRLKNEKNLIMSQYQNLSTFNKSYAELLIEKKQPQRQFSFRKSVQNVHKIISSQSQQKQQQKPIKQSIIRQQRHFGSINERNAPSSDENRNSRQETRRSGVSLESSKGILGGMRSRSKETFSTLEERFYQYCKTEMVRMNTENTKLTLKIGELQNKLTAIHRQYQLLQNQNDQLKVMNQSLEERLKSQNQKIQKINSQISISLAKKEEIVSSQFSHLQNQLKQLRSQEDTFRKQIQQQDTQIAILKADVAKKTTQCKNYAEIVAKNVSLQNQLNEVMIRNKKLADKFRRMPIIDHLWEIKEVQYENLVNLIQKEKGQLESLEKSRAMENRKSYGNPFDLTFSKEKQHF